MDCSRQSTGPANKIENEIKGYQNHEFSSTDEALIQKHGPLLFFLKKIARNFLLKYPLRNRANPEKVANQTLKRNKLE